MHQPPDLFEDHDHSRLSDHGGRLGMYCLGYVAPAASRLGQLAARPSHGHCVVVVIAAAATGRVVVIASDRHAQDAANTKGLT